MKRLLTLALLATVLVLSAVGAQAGVARKFSYQGVLTDDGGVVVPDGSYDLTVRLYTTDVGGSAVATETHTGVQVVRGGFSIIVGSITSLSGVDPNGPLYLSLQVGANPEMSPRALLTAAPYAMGLTLPAALTDNSTSPMLSLRNAGTGPTLIGEGTTQIGTSANAGKLTLRHPDGGANDLAALQMYSIFGIPFGGELRMNKLDGGIYAYLEPDAGGDGGYFNVLRPGGSSGFTVDGNGPNGSTKITIAGSSSTTSFDGGLTGDTAAELPLGSILANEIGDEPGIARAAAGNFQSLSGGVDALTSRTITAPQFGFVVAIGNAELWIDHVNGNTDRNILTVDTNVPGSIVDNTYQVFEMGSAAATDTYRSPVSVCGVFPVNAGSTTFYLLAQEVTPGASEGYAQNPCLTLLYFPSGYGTVTSSLPAGGDDSKARGLPLTPADIAAEQADARQAEGTRLQRELEHMRARLDVVQRQLAGDPQATPAKEK